MIANDLLIPVKKCRALPGVFRWPADAVLASPSVADALPLAALQTDLAELSVDARIVWNAFGPAALRVRRTPEIADPEAYRLVIAPDGISILAGGDAGAYYGVQTLRDLLALHGRRLPACRIDDWPDYRRRGVYHDCARGKLPTIPTLKALIERLARWKINELQLYIVDAFTFMRHPAIGAGYDRFTPGELLDLQEHCRRHHIRFVGSHATFGHMENILALPQYRRLGELPGYRGHPGGTTLYPLDPGSLRLVGELYEEFVPLFDAVDFNATCDEPWELGKGRSRPAAARRGVARLYRDFLLHVHALCRKHGKRMNVWADIVMAHPGLLKDFPKDIVMLNWDYDVEGLRMRRSTEVVAAGHPLVVCPGTNAWGSFGCRLAMGMRNIAMTAGTGLANGAEGLLNTDWGDNGHVNTLAISLHNLAYGAAHSWNHKATRMAGFTRRFCRHTFGTRDNLLAESVTALGGILEATGHPYANWTIPFRMFDQPLAAALDPAPWRPREFARGLDPARLEAHAESLSALRWPSPATARNRFEAEMLRQFGLASETDALACRRAGYVIRRFHGATPSPAERARLRRDTMHLAGHIETNWIRTNRPARLCEVLGRLSAIAAEYRETV